MFAEPKSVDRGAHDRTKCLKVAVATALLRGPGRFSGTIVNGTKTSTTHRCLGPLSTHAWHTRDNIEDCFIQVRIPCLRFIQVWPKPMEGFAYDQLKEVVKSFEVDGMRKGEFPFPSFTTAMQLVDRGGRAVEWAWVRTRNIDRFVSS